jgi:hypothetical protein
MKEYKFRTIQLSFWGRRPTEDYKEIIRENVKEGWNLVQIFAPAIDGYGAAKFYELIFEREI